MGVRRRGTGRHQGIRNGRGWRGNRRGGGIQAAHGTSLVDLAAGGKSFHRRLAPGVACPASRRGARGFVGRGGAPAEADARPTWATRRRSSRTTAWCKSSAAEESCPAPGAKRRGTRGPGPPPLERPLKMPPGDSLAVRPPLLSTSSRGAPRTGGCFLGGEDGAGRGGRQRGRTGGLPAPLRSIPARPHRHAQAARAARPGAGRTGPRPAAGGRARHPAHAPRGRRRRARRGAAPTRQQEGAVR